MPWLFWANKIPQGTQGVFSSDYSCEHHLNAGSALNCKSPQIQKDRNNPVGWVYSYFTSDFCWSGTLISMPSR